MPINPEIGVTFAACLRAILRQDPDKILVGETRDLETAEISIQASLTGHIVFTTLHTNDAPSAITRLRDMGLPTFLITATVEAVLAQRLVRKICHGCKTEFTPSPEVCMELGMTPEEAATKKFFYGKGCEQVQQHRLQGPDGDLRAAGHERHAPRDGRRRDLARRVPQRLPQVRHADPPRGRPEVDPRRA